MTMEKLPNTGEAVIIELGEAADIHPRNKQDVAKRLARWALAKDYGYDIPFRSPTYQSMTIADSKANLKFDHVGGKLDTFDVREPDIRKCKCEHHRQRYDPSLERRGEESSGRSLCLGHQPCLQCAKQRRSANDSVSHR